MATLHHNPVYINDMELMKADIEAADTVFELSNTSDNPNLLCIVGYEYAQAVEKSLRSIVRADRKDIYNKADRNGIRYVHKTHDITALLGYAETCRPGLSAKHYYINKNACKLNDFNNLRYGIASITRSELHSLSLAAKALVSELEQERLEKYADNEKNARHSLEQWQNRPETEFRAPKIKSEKQLQCSISGPAIDLVDYDLLRAGVQAADAILKASETSDNRYLLCLAGFHYGDTLQSALKAIIKTDRPDIYFRKDSDGELIFKNMHDMDKLMTKAGLCRPNIAAKYAYIAENSEQLQYISRLRYGRESTTKEEIRSLSMVVRSLVNELVTDFESMNPDQRTNMKNTRKEWERRAKTDLRIPDDGKDFKFHLDDKNRTRNGIRLRNRGTELKKI